MNYLLIAPLSLLFRLLCYLLNSFVVLFADEKGNLPKYLTWFQTHDSSLDIGKRGDELWSSIADKEEYPMWKRKLFRYFRRVAWIYRNTGYGFAYYICGYDFDPANIKVVHKDSEIDCANGKSGYYFSYDKSKSIWNAGWCLFACIQYGSLPYGVRIYMGWKLKSMRINGRTMLALHFNPLRRFR